MGSEIKEEEVCIKYFDLKHALPKYALKINSGLNYTLFVYGWLLLRLPVGYGGVLNSPRFCFFPRVESRATAHG